MEWIKIKTSAVARFLQNLASDERFQIIISDTDLVHFLIDLLIGIVNALF
ncbi:MAG: hypothetical protein FWG64_02040 [Firmicutes bacterium]|nr:hypothetical protein [Bacillota bacterium]